MGGTPRLRAARRDAHEAVRPSHLNTTPQSPCSRRSRLRARASAAPSMSRRPATLTTVAVTAAKGAGVFRERPGLFSALLRTQRQRRTSPLLWPSPALLTGARLGRQKTVLAFRVASTNRRSGLVLLRAEDPGAAFGVARQPLDSRRCRARGSVSRVRWCSRIVALFAASSAAASCLQSPFSSWRAAVAQASPRAFRREAPAAAAWPRVRAQLSQSMSAIASTSAARHASASAQRGLSELHAQPAAAGRAQPRRTGDAARAWMAAARVLVRGRWRGRVEHDVR